MSEMKQEIINNALYYQDHQRTQDEGNTTKYEAWHREVNKHFHREFLPEVKARGEKFVEYWPVRFLWGSKTEYKRGFADSQTYLYKSGNFATGYICLTDAKLRLVAIKKLTKDFPHVEGGASGFVSQVLQGMAGERDSRYPHEEDSVFSMPWESILAVDVGPDIYNQYIVAIRIRTANETWHVYRHFTDQEHEIETAIRMGMCGELKAIWQPAKPTPRLEPSPAPEESSQNAEPSDHILTLMGKLKDLRDACVITEVEFEEKKRELLSRL